MVIFHADSKIMRTLRYTGSSFRYCLSDFVRSAVVVGEVCAGD